MRGEAAACVWGEDGFARRVPHTASDAFLIKSGFPPATGAQIKGVGEGEGGIVREKFYLASLHVQRRRRVFLTRCVVRLHSGENMISRHAAYCCHSPARLLAESHSNPQIFVRGSQSCFTYWAAPGTKKEKKRRTFLFRAVLPFRQQNNNSSLLWSKVKK